RRARGIERLDAVGGGRDVRAQTAEDAGDGLEPAVDRAGAVVVGDRHPAVVAVLVPALTAGADRRLAPDREHAGVLVLGLEADVAHGGPAAIVRGRSRIVVGAARGPVVAEVLVELGLGPEASAGDLAFGADDVEEVVLAADAARVGR